ncbi:hypothetical protein GCM10017778_49430 [Streptomyces vinaceus]|nr:hypothetical protein GCM10017778_49430 [Streptomyces vinaceus]
MRDRVLDEGDDIGVRDLSGGEIGEDEGASDVKRLFQGGRVVHAPIVNPYGSRGEGRSRTVARMVP